MRKLHVAVGRAQGAAGGRSTTDLSAAIEIAGAATVGPCCEDN